MRGKPKDQIQKILIDRNPNYVSRGTITRALPKNFNLTLLDDALKDLVDSEKVVSEVDIQELTDLSITYYRMKDPSLYHVLPSIPLGDVDVPRLLSGSKIKFTSENLNEQIELLAGYTDNLERRFIKLVEKQQRRYWSNLIGIFGALLSVMALVITGLPKITVTSTMTFEEVFLINSAQILPIAIVLALFVIVLRIIIR